MPVQECRRRMQFRSGSPQARRRWRTMDQFEQILLQMQDGAFAVDSRRQVVFWNRTCERLLGVPARAALGQPCFQVIRAHEASGRRYCGQRCLLANLARGGAAPKAMPLWFSAGDGVPLQLSVSVFLLPSQQRGLWHVMHVLKPAPRANGTLPVDAAAAARGDGTSGCAGERRDAPRDDGSLALTPRESEVLGLLAQGHCTTEIARRLYLSPVTVRNHVQHLTAKLGLHSQLEAVAYAYRNDLVARDSRPGAVPQPAAGRAS
ncbi:MAG: PAS domain-containing protein [Betaproteobacteria bacterium]|nr:MAG: PAS domain-containing protein [Betaproteobacteria bacterium]